MRHTMALAVLAACATTQAPPAGPAPQPASSAPAAEGTTELRGVITYTAVRTDVMSVDAWLGDRIALTGPGGTQPLVPTAAVDKETLKRLDGHLVTVVVRWSHGEAPDPNLPAPMDGDQPMRRGVGFQVLSVKDEGEP